MIGSVIIGLVGTAIYGGLTYGILLSLWDPDGKQGMRHFFGFWVVAGLFGYILITAWQALLSYKEPW